MNADPLADLRDIHEPLAPHWFPPAPGWWLLAAISIGIAAYSLLYRQRRRRRLAPYRAAKTEFESVLAAYRAGSIDARSFVDGANEILKRLLIGVEGCADAVAASGDSWRHLLAEHFREQEFAEEPGRALGSERFRPTVHTDVEQTAVLVDGLAQRLFQRPRRRLR